MPATPLLRSGALHLLDHDQSCSSYHTFRAHLLKPVYILGTNGKVENPEKYSIEELLKIVGLNTGNLMFQYAVAQMIADPKVSRTARYPSLFWAWARRPPTHPIRMRPLKP